MRKRKYSLAEATQAFSSVGLELLANEYKSGKSPLCYRCKACGHEDELRLNYVLAKAVGCRKCGIKRRFERYRINFPELKAKLLERGIEVLSQDCAYSGSRIEIRCTGCGKVWEAKAGELLKTSCRRCMLRERAKRRTYSTEQVRQALKEMGVTLLSDYSKSESAIRVRFNAWARFPVKRKFRRCSRGGRCHTTFQGLLRLRTAHAPSQNTSGSTEGSGTALTVKRKSSSYGNCNNNGPLGSIM